MAEERSGFLGRWARRKTEVLQGKAAPEPVVQQGLAPVAGLPVPTPASEIEQAAPLAAADAADPPEKLLSLDDAMRLTQDSDFKPFMARSVSPDVRNAAMKKLFADPHYNVMDGLDIYIGDYSKPDPIPASMLRQMVGARLLKIFDEEDKAVETEAGAPAQAGPEGDAAEPLPRVNANSPAPEAVAQSDALPPPGNAPPDLIDPSSQAERSDGAGASQHDHAHSHLRLQPDHAPSAPSAGHGAS
ncbi:MAG: hypothetical protein JWR68_541 [Polaromonas sp.]|nr:hypothetical protein [Polaromonas sp.]